MQRHLDQRLDLVVGRIDRAQRRGDLLFVADRPQVHPGFADSAFVEKQPPHFAAGFQVGRLQRIANILWQLVDLRTRHQGQAESVTRLHQPRIEQFVQAAAPPQLDDQLIERPLDPLRGQRVGDGVKRCLLDAHGESCANSSHESPNRYRYGRHKRSDRSIVAEIASRTTPRAAPVDSRTYLRIRRWANMEMRKLAATTNSVACSRRSTSSMNKNHQDFAGLRVAAFESRRSGEMARMIEKLGGCPSVSPSMHEVPLDDHQQAVDFANRLITGEVDIVIFMTGVGARTLLAAVERHVNRQRFLDALSDVVTIVRGPKPLAELKEWGIEPTHRVPEPNTWRDLLRKIDAEVPIANRVIGLQEYGVTNPSLVAGLEARAQG